MAARLSSPLPSTSRASFVPPPSQLFSYSYRSKRKALFTTLCFVHQKSLVSPTTEETLGVEFNERNDLIARSEERLAGKRSERFTNLVAAVISSLGITSKATMSVYYIFSWQLEGEEVPLVEMFDTFSLSVGAAVGMKFWARWTHRGGGSPEGVWITMKGKDQERGGRRVMPFTR